MKHFVETIMAALPWFVFNKYEVALRIAVSLGKLHLIKIDDCRFCSDGWIFDTGHEFDPGHECNVCQGTGYLLK
jgi:hypothetical protein